MKASVEQREKQQTPAEIVRELLGVIRRQFYPHTLEAGQEKQWMQDQRFIRERVVLWPARWLNKRGVTLKPERYQAVLLGVFDGIKAHGATGAVKYWPGYLAHCVQEHFRCHGDEIYEEGKALRNVTERAVLGVQRALEAAPVTDPVARMAEAAAILAGQRRANKRVAGVAEQPTLFRL